MKNITHSVCAVIPGFMLSRIGNTDDGDDARATLEQMRELANERAQTFIDQAFAVRRVARRAVRPRRPRRAGRRGRLQGRTRPVARGSEPAPPRGRRRLLRAYRWSGGLQTAATPLRSARSRKCARCRSDRIAS